MPEKDRPHARFVKGVGCPVCSNRGYRGRTGVYEVLRMSDSLKRMVLEKQSSLEIKNAAINEGMMTMQQCGLRKVLNGTTSPEEVMRVVYVEKE